MPEDTDLDALLSRLTALASGSRRSIAAIAGPPASGKSTLAERLVRDVNAEMPGAAALLPMDGFHYDDLHLVPAGLRPRKGAPETFDTGGLAHVLWRLARDAEDSVAVPVFDRAIEIARAGARLIPRSARLIVAEGNYLLLDRAPWSALRGHFDLTVLIEVPEAELRRRLETRWAALTGEDLRFKLEENDLPNGRLVATGSIAPDLVLRQI